MTAHYIARIVESYYNQLDLDEMSREWMGIEREKYGRISDEWINRKLTDRTYLRWCRACYLLERYIKVHEFTFVETELVYKWAREACEQANAKRCYKRAFPYASKFPV